MPYAGYADAVVADLSLISATRTGRHVLTLIRDSGGAIAIERPEVLDPPLATVKPQTAGDGGRSVCTLAYEPQQWPNPIHPAIAASDVMLFTLLCQAALVSTPSLDEAKQVDTYCRERGYV
jgi:hypothetical protein